MEPASYACPQLARSVNYLDLLAMYEKQNQIAERSINLDLNVTVVEVQGVMR